MGVTLPLTGSGDATAEAATDTIAGEEYPYAKLVSGAVGATTPVNTGEGVATNAMRTTIANDSAVIGAVNEAAPGTDTASSGLNGRLQRIAQRLTSLITLLGGGLPSALSSDRLKVEAAAGTNLNTSALALESGGNLAAVAASASVLDDWDESDRAKVNPIAGQAGVQGGSGAVSANTLRVTHATDVFPGVQGDVAHDGVDSGNPVGIGGIARTANPTAVAALDRVKAWFTTLGKLIVQLNAPRELVVIQHTQIASSSSETTILTAGAAGVFHDITAFTITNQTATAVNVTIKDATTGTTRMIIALPAAAGGGWAQSFPVPIPQAAAANNWTATLSSAAVTVNVFVQAIKTT